MAGLTKQEPLRVKITKQGGNRKGQKMRGICPICKKEFQVTNKYGSRRNTCSSKCSKELVSLKLKRKGIKPPSQKGKVWGEDYPIENHNWWKGGITPLRKKIWNSREYQDWRNGIFRRDDYTCQKCGEKGYELQVDHHPVTFSEILEAREITSLEDAVMCEKLWDKDNGRTLCVDCHRKTETYGRNNRFRKNKWH